MASWRLISDLFTPKLRKHTGLFHLQVGFPRCLSAYGWWLVIFTTGQKARAASMCPSLKKALLVGGWERDGMDNNILSPLGLSYVKRKQVSGVVAGEGHQIRGRNLWR